MTSKWRDMTLREVYPYWILGEVPAADLPFIACNDMLAGNMDEEIVAVAALSQPDAWELDRVLPRTFSRLGLPPMTAEEAAKSVAPERMRDIAGRIVSREEEPLHGANAVYWCASDAGLIEDDNLDEQIAAYGVEFLQLADALEAQYGNTDQKRQLEDLIIEAAEALLAGQPAPPWSLDSNGNLKRGGPAH